MGGCNNDWHVVKSVIRYDKRTEETINWPSMNMHRSEFGASYSYQQQDFAVGGLGETDINHHQIEVLDMDYLADGWQEINVDLPARFCIENCKAAAVNSTIYIYSKGSNWARRILKFDTMACTFSKGPSLPSPCQYMISCGKSIIAVNNEDVYQLSPGEPGAHWR
jgi:hypothetical protein